MDNQYMPRGEQDLDALKKRARRRLIGAFVLAVIAVCFLPFMFHPPIKQGTGSLAFLIHYPYGNVCSYVRDWEQVVAHDTQHAAALAPTVSSPQKLTLKPTGHEHTLLVTPSAHH